MRYFSVICLLIVFCYNVNSQSVLAPNYGLKTPRTVEIVKVDFNDDATIVWLTLMSDINNAYFCIDHNTYLLKPDGSKLKVQTLKGLPYCPSTFRFKLPGEKVAFSLTFPATGVLPWFSVVEECAGGCLSVYGVVTDPGLNKDLTNAYALSDKGEVMASYRIFEDIINKTDSLNLGIEGAILSNLIMLDRKMGRNETARTWFDKLMTSGTPYLKQYLDNLKSQGVTYN